MELVPAHAPVLLASPLDDTAGGMIPVTFGKVRVRESRVPD